MINAILIDDELHALNVLNELLLKSDFSITILGLYQDIESAIESIKINKPDVVFLDVQMPNYAGYEIVKFFDKIYFDIIFVTAFDKYAINAFELNAIDYILKPIDRKKLSASLQRLNNKIERTNQLKKYQELLETIKTDKTYKLIIPELNNRRIIDIDRIIAIKADGAYSKLFHKDLKTLTVSKNLKFLEKKLLSTGIFFRCHRSWLINLNHVSLFNKTKGILMLSNTIEARISRKYYSTLSKALLNNTNDN